MTDSFPSDVAFTPTVKAIQTRLGSRAMYARMEAGDGWETTISPDLAGFIEAQTSVFLGTANADGQPYIQHRGGPAGFLHVLDDETIGFADVHGNGQFITLGNLEDNPRAHLFLIDFEHSQRVKIWGQARVVEDDPALLQKLLPQNEKARGARAILFSVAAWDANCPNYIPRRFEADDVARQLEQRDRRIGELERELADAQTRLLGSVTAAVTQKK
jgi:predicted pyridoxine 5'-phosphate oxidase superfamily flavin-nucleotide-binding protein